MPDGRALLSMLELASSHSPYAGPEPQRGAPGVHAHPTKERPRGVGRDSGRDGTGDAQTGAPGEPLEATRRPRLGRTLEGPAEVFRPAFRGDIVITHIWLVRPI